MRKNFVAIIECGYPWNVIFCCLISFQAGVELLNEKLSGIAYVFLAIILVRYRLGKDDSKR